MTIRPTDLDDLRNEAFNRLEGNAQWIFADDPNERIAGQAHLDYAKAKALLSISGELALIRGLLDRQQR